MTTPAHFLKQFFFNNGSFPLYAKALSLFDHKENMVRREEKRRTYPSTTV